MLVLLFNILKGFMFSKYGYTTLGISLLISFLFVVVSLFINNQWGKYSLIFIGIIILVFALNFFRDPDRNIPREKDIIVSPADGKVLIIKDICENRFLNEDATQISIFMSPFNVHVNRIPIDGRVDYLNYVEGDYLVAYHDKADERNERAEIGITSEHGKVLFTQVAGLVARRIIYDIKIGDTVKIGNRFGMIKFGSRVDVFVSKKWALQIKEGDSVTAGETILFRLK